MSQTCQAMGGSDILDVPTSNLLSYSLFKNINETKTEMYNKMHAIECNDIAVYIANYKIYEETCEFKQKINDIKLERETLLSVIDTCSTNSYQLLEFDRKISQLEDELAYKICYMNQEKIKYQKINEDISNDLDASLESLKQQIETLEKELDIEIASSTGSNLSLIENQYRPILKAKQDEILALENLQNSSWKEANSERSLGEMLDKYGLKFTASGKLFTQSGSRISFRTAEKRGIFAPLGETMNKVVAFVKNQEIHVQSQPSTPSTASIESSEDVRYLKHNLGKPLTLALAEIVAKRPTDPIHYLGHYLFKYRYNQELEQIRKDEIDELTRERTKLAQERWRRFIEEEARAAVMAMLIRVEEIIYQKELDRIAEEMRLAAEENEEMTLEDQRLLEEARDTFV